MSAFCSAGKGQNMRRIRLSKILVWIIALCAFSTLLSCFSADPAGDVKGIRKLTAVPFSSIVVTDGFWGPRIETNRTVTIPHNFRKCEETGRIDNFAKAGGLMKGKFEGIRFNDSDVFKAVEAASYSLSLYRDPQLEKYLDDLIAKIAAAQEDDGYLYTCRTIDPNNPADDAGPTRWSYLVSSHELYNVGHLYEAAVAHYRATGKRTLLDVALKNADLVANTFGPDKKRDVPGHQEIEIGLVKLYRVTGNKKYLVLAKFFLDQRGRADGHKLYGEYSQDHKPVVDQNEAVGHAVRAVYMYSGMADVAMEVGEPLYVRALERIWEDVVSKKLYLIGGIGARHGGESFGNDYELPNKSAYCETCASIANALWNHRMFLLYGDAKYIDVLERVIYNGFLSGISMKGDEFFYQNPLANDGDYQRSSWFGCACCPPNMARFIPSIPGFAYAHRDSDLYVNLFIEGNAIIATNSNTIYLKQRGRYPWDGNIRISVEPTQPQEFAVYIRIPGWAQNQPVPSDLYRYAGDNREKVTLKVTVTGGAKPLITDSGPRSWTWNLESGIWRLESKEMGKGTGIAVGMDKGFARIRRKWQKGDVVEVNLPMPVRRILSHQNVKDDAGKAAIQRGPVVYCFEGVDNPQGAANLVLPRTAELRSEYREELLGGVVTIKGQGQIRSAGSEPNSVEVVAIPYYAWAHRGKSQMAVWVAEAAAQDANQPAPTSDVETKSQAESVTFFVAADGNDSWSGKLAQANADRSDGPFASVITACQAARKIGAEKSRKVVVRAGRYFFDKPLVLGAEDAGLTIEPAPDAKVYFYGGREITGWQKDGENFYSVALPQVKERKWDFRVLIVNGRFCRRARVPAQGFFEHLSTFDVPWMTTTGGGWKRKPTNEELTTMKYCAEDIGPRLDVNNAELTIYHMWDESLVGISAIDANSQTITFSNPSGHPAGAFGIKKYAIWNVRDGMTEPGQWYLDRTNGKLVYWPLPGEDLTKAEVIAPTIESIIKIEGARDTPAKDITIRGLMLSVTGTPLKAGGFGAGTFDGAISIAFAEDCRLLDLEIVNAGGQGIKAAGKRLRIERCHIHHTGACGIKFKGDEIVAADNHIHDVGVTYPSAIAVSTSGRDLEISHNEVHDTSYSAVTCSGQNNRIEHNLIYRAMKELHDGAGIYITFCKNITLRGNFIRDIIDTGGYGASAYYLDEQAENCVVEENLSIGVVRPTHNHMARSNTIRNNVFISDGDMNLTFPRSSNYVFEKNILYAKNAISFENPDAIVTLQNNVLFSAKGQINCHKLKDYNRTGTYALEPNEANVFEDPLLAEYEKGVVNISPQSPAGKVGIKPIDVGNAGPRASGGGRAEN